jgi:hypothetical protein
MQSIFSNALSRAIAKHIDLSVTRRETLAWLTLLILQQGTICLWRLAASVASAAQTASVRRRFYRFFQFVRLDGPLAGRVVVDLLGLSGQPWVLAIDRTNWDFGRTTINILMISVVWNGIGIPLIWMLLPTAGNSNTAERSALLDRLRAAFPVEQDRAPLVLPHYADLAWPTVDGQIGRRRADRSDDDQDWPEGRECARHADLREGHQDQRCRDEDPRHQRRPVPS